MLGLNKGLEEEGVNFQKMGGHWMLKDLYGQPFGSKNLQGSYYLLFFGTSLCPDICPLTLNNIMKAKRRLARSSEGKSYI